MITAALHLIVQIRFVLECVGIYFAIFQCLVGQDIVIELDKLDIQPLFFGLCRRNGPHIFILSAHDTQSYGFPGAGISCNDGGNQRRQFK
ncbi:hypothetical protein D3C76_1385400 [compost metagenome]